ncbi:hypothetical protein PVAND_002498 [Polypedilum vanderplanki]|uniref:Uncharacterized protein n=1 Tax=Polypedilum vanderplanki TaxID=319348 RepID=A0A9J6BSQ6_POLVA|nr:hypothetical protein PVAND_002498 [Polypedilum vanderplanki]
MYLLNLRSLRILIYLSGLISIFLIIYYIYISNYNKNITKQNERKINFLMMQQQSMGSSFNLDGNGNFANMQMKTQQKEIINTINQMSINGEIIPEKYNEHVIKNRIIREKVKLMSENLDSKKDDSKRDIFSMNEDLLIFNKTVPNIHIFYYIPIKWYTPEKNQSVYQIDTIYYPRRGLYNFSNIEVAKMILREHLQEIRMCGIGVIIINWEPNNDKLNDLLPIIFHLVSSMNRDNPQSEIKITIQIGNYQDRTIESIRNNIKFFVDNFTSNPSFLKIHSLRRHKTLPLFYVRDAEHIKDWSKLLSNNGIITIRNTNYDSLILAHLESKESKGIIRKSNFDGFYSQNASNGANFFSTFKNWEKLKKFAEMYNLVFVPTISPGFHDAKPKYNTLRRFRSNGQYFEVGFKTALLQNTEFISIESYNNFIHGTQIEPVLPFAHSKLKDYSPHSPIKYLQLAQYWTNQFYRNKLDNQRHKEKKLCQNLLNNTIC